MNTGELDAILRVLNAGGNVAVPIVLWVSARYLSERLNEAYNRINEAHQHTVEILTNVVKENTKALTKVTESVAFLKETAERTRTAIAVTMPRNDRPKHPPDE